MKKADLKKCLRVPRDRTESAKVPARNQVRDRLASSFPWCHQCSWRITPVSNRSADSRQWPKPRSSRPAWSTKTIPGLTGYIIDRERDSASTLPPQKERDKFRGELSGCPSPRRPELRGLRQEVCPRSGQPGLHKSCLKTKEVCVQMNLLKAGGSQVQNPRRKNKGIQIQIIQIISPFSLQ